MADRQSSGGRRRDPSVDPRAMAAALDLVAEEGIEVVTMDAIATRSGVSKAALYRRWTSKEVLVVEAIIATGWNALGADLPSTGNLREDLVRIIGVESAQATTAKTRVLSGVLSIVGRNPAARHSIVEAIVEPRERAIRRAFQAAVDRKEVTAGADIELLATALPAMLIYRLLVRGQGVSRQWQYSIVDQLLVPAALIK